MASNDVNPSAPAVNTATPMPPRRRSRRRVLLISLGVVVLLLVVLVALLPTIAGAVAPGIIQSKADAAISGKVSVQGTSFSWSGPQRVTGFKLLDVNGKQVAQADVEVTAGLMGLARGNLDVGTVTLTGVKADIVKFADGTTNLQKAVAPRAKPSTPAPAPTPEIRIPDSLRAHVVAKGMEINFTDLTKPGVAQPVVTLRNMGLDATLGAGQPVVVVFDADAVSGTQTGRLAANIKAKSLIRNDGLVTPDAANIEADVQAKGLPLALVDALAPMGGVSVRKGLGDTLDITIKANGNLKDATATLTATSANATANADLRIAAGVLTAQSPIDVSIKGAALRAMVPAIDASLKGQDSATIDTFPDARLTVQSLKVPIPSGGAMDLRGGAATVVLNLSETTGTVLLDAGGKRDPFRIAPLEARIDAADLAKIVHVTAASSATLSGQPAGELSVDLTLAGLLDAAGAPKGPPANIQGTLAVRKIATIIAQPFVQAMKLDLPKDVGPTLDIELRAGTGTVTAGAAGGSATSGGALTNVDVTVQSQGVRVKGGFALSSTSIASTGDGLRIEVATAAQMAGRLVDPSTGWQVTALGGAPSGGVGAGQSAGGAVVTLKNLSIPRDAATGAMQLDRAAGRVDVSMTGLSVRSTKSPATSPIEVRTMTLGAQLAAGGAGHVDLASTMEYAGSPFGATGAFDIPALILPSAATKSAAMAPVAQLRPVGKLEIKDIPTALSSAFLPPAAPTVPAAAPTPGKAGSAPVMAAAPIDLGRLLVDMLGQSISVTLNTAAVNGSPDGINVALAVQSATTTAEVRADVEKTQVVVQKVAAQATLTPQSVTGLTSAFAPGVTGAPRLVGPARLVLTVDPITIPLKDYSPQVAQIGLATVHAGIPGRTMVDGLTATNADGTKRDLGRLGIDSLDVLAKAPVAALMGPAQGDAGKATVNLSGTVMGGQDQPLMELTSQVVAQLSVGKVIGPLTATAKLAKIDTVLAEKLAGQDGKISGALGNSASVDVGASLTLPTPAAGSTASAFDFAQASGQVQATVAAPRLHSDGPIILGITPASFTLTKPAKLVMDVDPVWANKMLEPKPDAKAASGAGVVAKVGGGKPAAAAVRVTDPTTVTLSLDSLVYPRGGGAGVGPPVPGGMAKEGLRVGLGVLIPDLKMVSSDNQPLRLTQMAMTVQTQAPKAGAAGAGVSPPLEYQLTIGEARIGDQPASKAMTLRGTVIDLIDGTGAVNMTNAVVNASGDLPTVPTAFVDALAKQDGMLVDALGPVVSLQLQVDRFPLGTAKAGGAPPVVQIKANSARATAELHGTVKDSVFVSDTPLKMTVVELTQALAGRLIKGLPVVGSLEKTRQDAPATVVGNAVTAAIGNDMSKLNGEFAIDPGEARFGTSSVFGSLLKSVNQKQTGTVGKRLQPLQVSIKNGVATYTKWKIPIGQFDVETEGTVDLVNKTVDVLTYLPFGQLSEKAAGGLGGSVGGLLGKLGTQTVDALTMVPFRTKGPLDSPHTAPDLELFAKTAVKQLKPEDVIKQGLGDLLKKQIKPPK